MKGPIIVTTEVLGKKSIREIQPIDPSYNLLK